MNKENIYRIIGYTGEYTTSVKKAIRKLLKDNHPDNNGDRKIFELINEVKKELEENRVPIEFNKKKTNIPSIDDIDYSYCIKMMDELSKEKEEYLTKFEAKKKELSDSISEYNDYYHNSIDLETYLLSNSQYVEKLKSTKTLCIILLILAIITFTISVYTKKIIFLGIFVLITVICVLMVHKAFFTMQKITDNNRNKVKNYVGVNNKIRRNQNIQKVLKKELHELDRKVKSLENDIRFYDNIISNR